MNQQPGRRRATSSIHGELPLSLVHAKSLFVVSHTEGHRRSQYAVKVVRSHIVKHGASDNVAASGAPQPASMQMEKHKNKVAFRIYQAKEALEMAEYRQLLNAPPGLRRTDRTFSQLDVFLAVKKELSRANFHHAKEVLWASGGVGVVWYATLNHKWGGGGG